MTIDLLSFINNEQIERLQTTLEKVSYIQQKFANLFPFENIDVLLKDDEQITERFLFEKMVVAGRGGLCYEINGLLYLVLKQLNFDVSLVAATMAREGGWATDRTHAMIILKHDNSTYIVDNGAGSHISLRPIPLNGKTIKTNIGKFRARQKKTVKGNLITERYINNRWELWYAGDSKPIPWYDLTVMKNVIHTNEKSAFNKQLLIAKIVSDGTISINEERFLKRRTDGSERRLEFKNNEHLLQTIKKYSSKSIYLKAKSYLNNKFV